MLKGGSELRFGGQLSTQNVVSWWKKMEIMFRFIFSFFFCKVKGLKLTFPATFFFFHPNLEYEIWYPKLEVYKIWVKTSKSLQNTAFQNKNILAHVSPSWSGSCGTVWTYWKTKLECKKSLVIVIFSNIVTKIGKPPILDTKFHTRDLGEKKESGWKR